MFPVTIKTRIAILIPLVLMLSNISFSGSHPSYSENIAIDTVPFYSNANYNSDIPHPNSFFQHSLGQWPHRYHELTSYLKVLSQKSDRLQLEPNGFTHEGRALYNLFISNPENISRLKQIRNGIELLANPQRNPAEAEIEKIIQEFPAVAWMGYNIHGDELSGTDAAAYLAYHLAAAQDEATKHILDNVLIILDPCENPDGRERYISMLQTYKSKVPNYDHNSAAKTAVWPWGRANHYLFDLNRDWILLTQPETRARVKTIITWNPQMVVDAHEMGALSTYLFSPPRQPINYNIPENVMKWYDIYNRDHSAAFDLHRWPYYAGEWNEQWYPGYGSAWPTFHGAVGILYEQAGVDGAMVKQNDGYILTFHEAINHQFTSSIANLKTTADNREQLLRDYLETRKSIVAKGKKSGLMFLYVPDGDQIKTKRFIDALLAQGIKVTQAQNKFTVSQATDIYHDVKKSKTFPAGTYVVSTAQPMGALAKAILEFDLHLNYEFLKEERRELEKHGGSRLYEVTSWSVSLAYDMDAWYSNSSLNGEFADVSEVKTGAGQLINPDASYGYIIDMEGEKTYRILERIFAHELIVHAASKPFTIEGRSYKAGALMLRSLGNKANIGTTLGQLASEIGINVYGVNTGKATEGSYLGASSFNLLIQPRIALVTGTPMNFTSVGSLWFAIDYELEIPHSLLMASELSVLNLDRYNVLILPSAWGNSFPKVISAAGVEKIKKWVSDGGTLVCTGQSAVWAADSTTGLSQVRLKRQSLDMLGKYQIGLDKELRAESPPIDTMDIWHPATIAKKENNKKPAATKEKLSSEELEELDKWQRKFQPRGTILSANLDKENWLNFGMKDRVPAIVYTTYAFLANKPVKTAARFSGENSLRLGGLLWPEARERWANSVYATTESHGRGQIILFATDPNMRAYFYGTRKMFINAILYGPGMIGAESPYK